MRHLISLIFVGTLSIVLVTQAAFAGGYEVQEQSARGVGTAMAGASVGFGDGSSAYYNPAAMAALDESTFSFSGHVLFTKAKFSNMGSTDVTGAPLTGGNDDGGGTAFVPNLYAVHPLSDDWTIGLGINSPYGLETKYDDSWVGRYHGTKSSLMTININPAVSYENSGFSIGAAARIIYADADLRNAVDFGTIGLGALGAQSASMLGLLPQQADGSAKVTGTDWGFGFTVGGAYRYGDNEENMVGLVYRSPIKLSLTGDAEFGVPANAQVLTQTGNFTNTSAKASVTMPEVVSAGARHYVSDEVALLGEVAWTRWSRFDELRVEFGNGQPDSVTPEDWKNTWRFSLGVLYHATEDLQLTAGYQYDREPIPSAQRRTPRIPGNDRNWLALGVGYDFTDSISGNLSYAHVFVKDGSSDITGSTGDNLRGDWNNSVDIVSASIIWRLGEDSV